MPNLKRIFTRETTINCIVGISGAILGIILYGLLYNNISPNKHSSKGMIFTNPALNYYELEEMITSNKIINLSKEIGDYASYKKSVGDLTYLAVYYRNLNNGGYFGINQNEEFSPASLMKLPILVTYLKKSETITGFLNLKITYRRPKTQKNYKQNFLPGKQLEENKEYTLWEICQHMIQYSDNDASVFLEKLLPPRDIKSTFEEMGVRFPEFDENGQYDNNIRIIDYAAFFRILFNASYLNRENSEKALKLLSQIEFHEGINQGIPLGINISHKFGERGIIGADGKEEKQLHDCGIIYYPNHPYVLCVMSRGYNRENLKTAIGDVSRIIYNEVQRQYGEDPLDTSNGDPNNGTKKKKAEQKQFSGLVISGYTKPNLINK